MNSIADFDWIWRKFFPSFTTATELFIVSFVPLAPSWAVSLLPSFSCGIEPIYWRGKDRGCLVRRWWSFWSSLLSRWSWTGLEYRIFFSLCLIWLSWLTLNQIIWPAAESWCCIVACSSSLLKNGSTQKLSGQCLSAQILGCLLFLSSFLTHHQKKYRLDRFISINRYHGISHVFKQPYSLRVHSQLAIFTAQVGRSKASWAQRSEGSYLLSLVSRVLAG